MFVRPSGWRELAGRWAQDSHPAVDRGSPSPRRGRYHYRVRGRHSPPRLRLPQEGGGEGYLWTGNADHRGSDRGFVGDRGG